MAAPPVRHPSAMWVGSGIGTLSFEEALLYRREFIPESSCLHFAKSPVCLERGRGQYLYDDKNCRYLDCFSSSCPVGHCHPDIVTTGRKVLSHFLTRSLGELRDGVTKQPKRKALKRDADDVGIAKDISQLLSEFMTRLRKRLPKHYDTFYFAKSGSEANDIALYIARKYTEGSETLVIDQSHHGDLSAIAAVSARMFRRHKLIPESWVHVLPLPTAEQPSELLFSAKSLIADLQDHGRKLCCLMCEPVFGLAGVFTPPRDAVHDIVELVRENGGLWIADEILTGMGRLGSHFWGFELLNCGGGRKSIYPDILTVGKPLGNGFPISLIVTRKEIAKPSAMTLEPLSRPPLEGAIAATVLRLMDDDRLLESVDEVGRQLKTSLQKLAKRHAVLGDVRGQGLLISIDVVLDKGSRNRNKVDALHLWYMLKDRKVLCCLEGPDRSALMLQPPLCFNEADAVDFVQALSDSVDALNVLLRPGPEIPETNGSNHFANYLRNNDVDDGELDRISNGSPIEQSGYPADFSSLD